MPIESLTTDQIDSFNDQGYVLLPGIIEPEYGQRLIVQMDELIAHRSDGNERMIISYRELGMLTSHPPVVNMVEQLVGGTHFSMHHIHSTRHEPGDKGGGWHQDYEQIPQTNRTHVMVHVFYYLSGLNGEIGDLVVLPRSQHMIAQRDLRMLDSIDLPGSMCIDDLEPGSAVIVHSAVWHTRRPKPGGAPAAGSVGSISLWQRKCTRRTISRVVLIARISSTSCCSSCVPSLSRKSLIGSTPTSSSCTPFTWCSVTATGFVAAELCTARVASHVPL